MTERRVPAHLADLVQVRPGLRSPSDPTVPARTGSEVATTPVFPTRQDGIAEPHNPAALERIVASTPSKIATGRAGTRYRTATYLRVRSDHAIARDAVYAEMPEALPDRLGCMSVQSQCESREHYLLQPNLGRRLSDMSRALLEEHGTRGADVQIIIADGLSTPAVEINVPTLLPSLVQELHGRGLSVGKPILARLARVGLQDDIGVLLGSRATAICLGERPGLGTGDSLSIYIAIAPRLDQDNAEKNCISNIRPQGLRPEVAATLAADLLQRGLALGKGGLALARLEGSP